MWCRLRDSNSRPLAYEATALPTELSRHGHNYKLSSFYKQVKLQIYARNAIMKSMRCPYCNHHIPTNTSTCPHCHQTIPDEKSATEVLPEAFDAPVRWTKNDTFALVGFGLGLISGGILSPVGLFFSGFSLKGKQKNRWVSYWGIGANIVLIILWIVVLIVLLANLPR